MTCKLCGKQIYPVFNISPFCAECFIKTRPIPQTTFKSNRNLSKPYLFLKKEKSYVVD